MASTDNVLDPRLGEQLGAAQGDVLERVGQVQQLAQRVDEDQDLALQVVFGHERRQVDQAVGRVDGLLRLFARQQPLQLVDLLLQLGDGFGVGGPF